MKTSRRRLRHLSAREVHWRARSAIHTLAERARTRFGDARWNRQDIRRVVDRPTRAVLDHALSHGDWLGVQDQLVSRITSRQTRFILDPAAASLLRERICGLWPDAPLDAAADAERLLRGAYDLLGYHNVRVYETGDINWHKDAVHHRSAPRVFYADVPYLNPTVGDHKVIWELNRHQHWLTLGRAALLSGDPRYAHEIRVQLDSWLAANPPLVGINWASMLEIGLRAISWTWTAHCLLGIGRTADAETPWLVDMLLALDRQLTHVERHLSYYFSPNTHLTGEALALYVVGTAFPELAASRRWIATGRRVLLGEIDRQILDDGGHVERSTHYQRYTLDFYLMATLTARLAADDDAARRFEDAAMRLARFTRTIADDSGRLPMIGDDDGGMLWPLTGRACSDVRDSLAVAASVLNQPDLAPWGINEEVLWIAGPNAAEPSAPAPSNDVIASRRLRDTGYFVARGADGSHSVFDVGAHGYLNGGHAHADALSLTLTLNGRPVLIDPGTATYTVDAALRDRMRSSQSHNTVTLDNRSPSVPAGPFHWRSTTDARVIASRHNPSFDWIEGTHDGYGPARHRRTLVRSADGGWLIVDAVGGEGRRRAAAHWHFDPAWRVTDVDVGRIRGDAADGNGLWMLHAGGQAALFRGDAATGLGWCAPVYGVTVPTCTVRLACDGEAPFTLTTWVGDAARFRSPSLHAARVDAEGETAVVVEIVDTGRSAVFLVRPADSSGTRPFRAGEYETDALFLHYAVEDGRLRSLSLAGGRHCITARDRWFSIAADRPIPDLHIDSNGDTLNIHASEPPGELTLNGTAGLTTIRANGRHLPLSSKPAPDSLLILGSDWAVFSAENAHGAVIANSGAAFARE